MRLQRRRWRVRAFRKRRELRPISDRTAEIKRDDILLFSTQRNEKVRLPFFLKYYRELGVNHFFFVDNDSTDGSLEYLMKQPDVSVWFTKKSYKRSRFGVDWLNWLQMKYADGHWSLVLDPDEFLIYPFCDTRPLRALTDWLDASSIKSFSAMLLDMYPKGRIDAQPYSEGQDPMEITNWFDSGNYAIRKNKVFGNLWIQGGPRARMFFRDLPEKAPALNKIPLVKWDKKYAYVSSTHMLLPRGLNLVYDEWGGEKASGVLLHTKFLDTFSVKAQEELDRKQHYAASREYKAYAESLVENPDLWCKWSEKYINWRQLEILGLMSKGNWA
ncbi:glycosyltransferase family 2 protein [Aquicoccus sp. G2-2]|uniref:glycosyltransferase family 2 protein n=1 Tax=Aquicoccus sp. G2-2 TaxID=3092120 RepID=UPI002ADFD402|nr:glycosyltransferase family 2 protein [Aquicoccus sp. G2-2]MEA1114649.1 glycosyltransferase family 2 protein [Aquicoccus sp. G2-2]